MTEQFSQRYVRLYALLRETELIPNLTCSKGYWSLTAFSRAQKNIHSHKLSHVRECQSLRPLLRSYIPPSNRWSGWTR